MLTLVVSNDFLPRVGGIEQYTTNIATRLDGVAAVVPPHPDASRFDAGLPFNVHRSLRRTRVPGGGAFHAIQQAARHESANVLLLTSPWPHTSVAPRLGLPWAACTHGAEFVLPSRLPALATLFRRALSRADCLFTVSRYTGTCLRHLVGDAGPPIRYLRTGVPLDTFHPQVSGTVVRERHGIGDRPLVVCIGRLVARKGQDVLIRALPSIQRRVPEACILVVGEGPYGPTLRRLARGLEGTVMFAGAVPWSDLPLYHAAADVFACPNRSRHFGLEQEGFGVVFLEAQASGRPVVAGRSGGAPEALVEGETGVVVDGTSVREVGAAVGDLLAQPELARGMGSAGRSFVERDFDWAGIVARLHGDLERLARRAPVESEL
jgi:phosphatidylinositol alpha-1,6-mannosyltransferase